MLVRLKKKIIAFGIPGIDLQNTPLQKSFPKYSESGSMQVTL
tara:strand:+ start:451 stop:576 length:126 start_codon:yes stop_codon:yes gene_type:complete